MEKCLPIVCSFYVNAQNKPRWIEIILYVLCIVSVLVQEHFKVYAISFLLVLHFHRFRVYCLPVYFTILNHFYIVYKDGYVIYPKMQLLCIGFSVILTQCLIKIIKMPKLTGAYQVGGRLEAFGPVECRVFYPCIAHSLEQEMDYLEYDDYQAQGVSRFTGLPPVMLEGEKHVKIHARKNAAVCESPENGFPVALFSPGLGATLEMYAAFTTELASQGFVVVVMNHTDGSAAVCRRNGELELFKVYAAEDLKKKEFEIRNKQLQTRMRDVTKVLNGLEKLDGMDTLQGKLNLSQVFMYGHSFGAGTALYASHQDSRIKGCVLHDAWMIPIPKDIIATGPMVPMFHMVSGQFHEWPENYALVEEYFKASANVQHCMYVVKESGHNNFIDVPLFFPQWINIKMTFSGIMDARYGIRTINKVTFAYFQSLITNRDVEFQHLLNYLPEWKLLTLNGE